MVEGTLPHVTTHFIFFSEEYEKVLSGAEKDEKIQHVKELLDSYEQVEAKSAM